MKILFICRGNVGRSQIAETLAKSLLDDKHIITSAGTKLSGPEQPIGELSPSTDNVIEVMKEEGFDVTGNLRKQVTEEMAEDADKIILVVDDDDPIPNYLLNNPKVTRWDVQDPKGQTLEFTRNVRDQIKSKITSLI
ncbi:MAG: hypothetical protein K8Q91_01255 [Candidatus Vogelbacteria bacterium]|nr:hypothetical protein [Candidatus Vogelbacteria bacterium]